MTKKSLSIAELVTGRKHKAKILQDTGYTCTAYFKGKDGQGKCSTGCQWWNDDLGCPCAKGSPEYDGQDEHKSYSENLKILNEKEKKHEKHSH